MSQQIKQIPTPPFCCDCQHFIPADNKVANDEPRCRKFPMLDIVMGTRFFVQCAAVRGEGAPCGQSGQFFEPVDDMDAPKTGLN